MLVKTSTLEGRALNWAVALCIGKIKSPDDEDIPIQGHYRDSDGLEWPIEFNPSQNGDHGLPILEKFITKLEDHGEYWSAEGPGLPEQSGPSILTAGMRCIVSGKMGDWIDVPDSLLEDHEQKEDDLPSDS